MIYKIILQKNFYEEVSGQGDPGAVLPRTRGRDQGCGDPSAALETAHDQSAVQAHATAPIIPGLKVQRAQARGPAPAPPH